MLRIVVAERSESEAMVRREGQVIGAWVGELERTCESFLMREATLHLDLASVSFVGRDGVQLLGRLRERGARLLHCSPFVTEQLKAPLETPSARGSDGPSTGLPSAPGPEPGQDPENPS